MLLAPPLTSSFTRLFADAPRGGVLRPRLAPFDATPLEDSGIFCPDPHELCCDARDHAHHLWVLRDDDSTDIDGRVSSVPLKRLLMLRGGFNPVALAGSLAKSSASFFIKPAVENYLGKSDWVTDIRNLIKSIAISLPGG